MKLSRSIYTIPLVFSSTIKKSAISPKPTTLLSGTYSSRAFNDRSWAAGKHASLSERCSNFNLLACQMYSFWMRYAGANRYGDGETPQTVTYFSTSEPFSGVTGCPTAATRWNTDIPSRRRRWEHFNREGNVLFWPRFCERRIDTHRNG